MQIWQLNQCGPKCLKIWSNLDWLIVETRLCEAVRSGLVRGGGGHHADDEGGAGGGVRGVGETAGLHNIPVALPLPVLALKLVRSVLRHSRLKLSGFKIPRNEYVLLNV